MGRGVLTVGTASVEIEDDGDVLVVGTLRGQPHDVLSLITQIKAMGRPVRMFVSFADDWEKLMHLYGSFGAVPVGFVMEYAGEKSDGRN